MTILQFNQTDKNRATELFLENLENEDWQTFLIEIGTIFEELKAQFQSIL